MDTSRTTRPEANPMPRHKAVSSSDIPLLAYCAAPLGGARRISIGSQVALPVVGPVVKVMATLNRRPLISGGVGQVVVQEGELRGTRHPVIHAVVSVHIGESHCDAREEDRKQEQDHTDREVSIPCDCAQADRLLSSPSRPDATSSCSDQTIPLEHSTINLDRGASASSVVTPSGPEESSQWTERPRALRATSDSEAMALSQRWRQASSRRSIVSTRSSRNISSTRSRKRRPGRTIPVRTRRSTPSRRAVERPRSRPTRRRPM
jgi:hypothetical protein